MTRESESDLNASRDGAPFALVTGATGSLGPAVVRAMLDDGWRIRTLARRPPPHGRLPAEVESHIGDVSDPTAVQQACTGTDAVVHLAALLHVFSPGSERRVEYERINVQGTANILEAALAVGVPRVVVGSTIAVYPPTRPGDPPRDEKSPTDPGTFYAETKLRAEQLALAALREDGRPLASVLRLAATYGPRIQGNYLQLVQGIASGKFMSIGSGKNRRTLVYDADVGAAVALAARHPAAAGEVYNVTDGQCHTMQEITQAISMALGQRSRRVNIPVWAAKGFAMLLENVSRRGNIELPLNREALGKYLEDLCVSGTRIQEELGFTPRYDLETGWATAIQALREAGTI